MYLYIKCYLHRAFGPDQEPKLTSEAKRPHGKVKRPHGVLSQKRGQCLLNIAKRKEIAFLLKELKSRLKKYIETKTNFQPVESPGEIPHLEG